MMHTVKNQFEFLFAGEGRYCEEYFSCGITLGYDELTLNY